MVTASLRLFRLFGITVYLHWSWLVVAAFMMWLNKSYDSPAWFALEYVSLFVIVLTHEFGHALACRSVGGQADTIILWPLGGVAFVSPPLRPGAWLWSIAAGPLVNVLLVPITGVGLFFVLRANPGLDYATMSDGMRFLFRLFWVNTALLVFNILPIYPLDGGQILQSILWFFVGFVRSLKVVSIIGLIGAGGLVVLALSGWGNTWTFILAFFIGSQAFNGYQRAQAMARMARLAPMPPPGQYPGQQPYAEPRRVIPPPVPSGEAIMPPNPGDLRPPRW
jgi:Zn-dependent protease